MEEFKKNQKGILDDFKLKSFNKYIVHGMYYLIELKTVFAIILANYFIYLLFIKEFSGVNTFTLLKLIIISFFILKTQLFMKILKGIFYIWKIYQIKKYFKLDTINKINQFSKEILSEYSKVQISNFILQATKGFIFTFFRFLFPITLFWILFLLYLIIRYSSYGEIGIFVSSEFITLMTMFGIIISLFQFYLSDIKSRKNTEFKIISDRVKDDLLESIYVADYLFFLFNKYPELYNRYEHILKEKAVERVTWVTGGGNREKISAITKYHPNIVEFFSYIESDIKSLNKRSPKEMDLQKILIKQINKSYTEYLESKKQKIIETYKDDKSIDRELLLEYLLNSTEGVNTELLSHYFEEEVSEKELEKEIIGFNHRYNELYIECLIILVFWGMKKETKK